MTPEDIGFHKTSAAYFYRLPGYRYSTFILMQKNKLWHIDYFFFRQFPFGDFPRTYQSLEEVAACIAAWRLTSGM